MHPANYRNAASGNVSIFGARLNLWINKTKTATCTIYVSGQYRFEVAKILIFIVDNIYRASFNVAVLF